MSKFHYNISRAHASRAALPTPIDRGAPFKTASSEEEVFVADVEEVGEGELVTSVFVFVVVGGKVADSLQPVAVVQLPLAWHVISVGVPL
jgi:hypothetical protein